MESRSFVFGDLCQFQGLDTCSWYSKDSQDEWLDKSPPEMLLLTFFKGAKDFPFATCFFCSELEVMVLRQESQQLSNPTSKVQAIPEVSLIWSKPFFCNRSFPASICQASNMANVGMGFPWQVCPSTASCPLWPTQRPSIISPCVASSFCCPSSWASWFCI